MPKDFLRRHLPTPAALRAHRALRPISHWLNEPELWHLHRRSVAGATFIGLFCAFLPVPFQMLIAAVMAIASRCNLPISIVLVWITNPLTITPMFYFAYRLGAWLLDERIEVGTVELSWHWLSTHLAQIGWPLLFGSLVCGWVAGVTGLVLVRVGWRLHVKRRWQERARRRRERKREAEAARSVSRGGRPLDSAPPHAAPESTLR